MCEVWGYGISLELLQFFLGDVDWVWYFTWWPLVDYHSLSGHCVSFCVSKAEFKFLPQHNIVARRCSTDRLRLQTCFAKCPLQPTIWPKTWSKPGNLSDASSDPVTWNMSRRQTVQEIPAATADWQHKRTQDAPLTSTRRNSIFTNRFFTRCTGSCAVATRGLNKKKKNKNKKSKHHTKSCPGDMAPGQENVNKHFALFFLFCFANLVGVVDFRATLLHQDDVLRPGSTCRVAIAIAWQGTLVNLRTRTQDDDGDEECVCAEKDNAPLWGSLK